jgi:pimeloyl-ACP methyl ester carboxylesterase
MKFTSWCDSGNETILFIHSLFSADWEWAPTILHLVESTSFHIITPTIEPNDFLDLDRSASILAQHIKEKAKGGQAHIVGLSMGVHIALHLRNSFPEVISTILLSGYITFSPILRPIGSLVIYTARKRQHRRTGVPVFSLQESQAMFRVVSSPPLVQKASARTLIVAGLLEDNIKSLTSLKKSMSGGQRIDIIGFLHKGHLWNRSCGKEFGDLLVAWTKGGEQWMEDLNGSLQDLVVL